MQKRWKIKEAADVPLIEKLFAHRGIETEADKEAFLNPDFETGVHDPFLFRQMEQAVARIFSAIENGEHITVHGDYDADGVSGSAVLITTLRELEARIWNLESRSRELEAGIWNLESRDSASEIPDSSFKLLDSRFQIPASRLDSYIPHRDKEGYGLNLASVQFLKDRGTNLIVTVDCGIANVEEIAFARSLGMDVIVVDHHQFGDVLPDAILIHPRLPGETYPFPHLAAVGVAWKVACALVVAARNRGVGIPDGFEKWLLDFVSIATVTDMVKMTGENRVLETFGLKVMNKTRRPGLKKLIEAAGYQLGEIDSEAIGFGLGPRINAAGRMDHASLALKLLVTENDEEAIILARELESKNRERQQATKAMMEEAEKQLEARSLNLEARSLKREARSVTPAQAGVQDEKDLQILDSRRSLPSDWIPASAGMTDTKLEARSWKLEARVPNVESLDSRFQIPDSISQLPDSRLIALWSDTWSPSLVGLVAGKFLDKTGKPAIAIGKHGDRWIGSGRSIAAYDITQAVKVAGEGLLTHSGGHVQACGFSFSNDEHLPTFIERLQEHAASSLREEECVPILDIDAEIALDDVTWPLVETLEKFEPFGEGNKKPLFVSRGLTVISSDLVGQNKNHVRCRLKSPSGRVEQFIGFKLGDRAQEVAVGNVVDVAYDVGVNEWNGRRNIQCKLIDFRVA